MVDLLDLQQLDAAMGSLDALAAELVARAAPVRFTSTQSAAALEAAYRLRYRVVVERGWARQPGSFNFHLDTNEGEGVGRIGRVVAAGGRAVRCPGAAQNANREVAQCGHHLGDAAGADLRAILIERHIPHPMRPIFHVPVLTDQPQQRGRIGPLRPQTRHPVDDLLRHLARPALDPPSLDAQHLLRPRPIQVRLQGAAGAQSAHLDAPVPNLAGCRRVPGRLRRGGGVAKVRAMSASSCGWFPLTTIT